MDRASPANATTSNPIIAASSLFIDFSFLFIFVCFCFFQTYHKRRIHSCQ
ncbi:hypothetical protein HMPREF0352_0725 [Enterococcus faecium TX1330]|nr:hypothetical protein HMPREF0352_0725 [Enterococcus faecium TX1330]